MDLLQTLTGLFLHLDAHLADVIRAYGPWTYALLFLIVFCETGLIVTPFLPGDSLIFAAGTFAGMGVLSLPILILLLGIAAIAGDSVNYAIGSAMGPKVFRAQSRFLRQEYLERTRTFYARHGAKTIVLARFIPIVRTFAPFVAGIGKMPYETFAFYNVLGAILWVVGFSVLGYAFGNVPLVRDHFSTVILAIIVVSLIPGIVEYVRNRRRKS